MRVAINYIKVSCFYENHVNLPSEWRIQTSVTCLVVWTKRVCVNATMNLHQLSRKVWSRQWAFNLVISVHLTNVRRPPPPSLSTIIAHNHPVLLLNVSCGCSKLKLLNALRTPPDALSLRLSLIQHAFKLPLFAFSPTHCVDPKKEDLDFNSTETSNFLIMKKTFLGH